MTGRFIIVTGPSASGKTRLVEALIRLVPGSARLVTVTTRAPRKGERDGIDYFFVSRAEFEKRIADGDFFEHAQVYTNLYGTSKRVLDSSLETHPYVFAVIDVQGAKTLRAKVPGSLVLFVRPSDASDIERRIRGERIGAPLAEIEKRIEHATHELSLASTFDHVIDNIDGKFDLAVEAARRALA